MNDLGIYFAGEGVVYSAPRPRDGSHQPWTTVGSYLAAHQFVAQEFHILVAHYDEWLVARGHPGWEGPDEEGDGQTEEMSEAHMRKVQQAYMDS